MMSKKTLNFSCQLNDFCRFIKKTNTKHNDKYTTLYAHLSKYKKGISKGSYVTQGEVIGYVGSTGYSTGPHLHYEFMVNGKHVDPFKQTLPPSLPLEKENTEAFNKIRDKYTNILVNFVK